jgi:ERCC4-type nuclease
VLGIPLLPSPQPTGTAALLASLAKQLQMGFQQPGGSPVKKAKTLAEQQLDVLMALGRSRRALLARFGSVVRALQASVEELTSITGITPARRNPDRDPPHTTCSYSRLGNVAGPALSCA